jgi:hypothetical protein
MNQESLYQKGISELKETLDNRKECAGAIAVDGST